MKKIFTMFIALLSVTTLSAQTPAQELNGAVYSGTASLKINMLISLTFNVSDQKVSFNTNTSDVSKTNMSLTEAEVTALGSTVTMKEAVACVSVSKSGSTYSLGSETFDLVLNNGTADANVTGQVTSSSITANNGSATIVVHISNLPNAMTQKGISSLDVTYSNFSQSHVTAINGIPTESKNSNVKVLKDGKVTIFKDGVEYNAVGQRCK